MTESTTSDDAALTVRDLDIDIFTADGPRRVVHGLHLDLIRGRTLGIVGESGSGKSLTANAIMGILPDVAAAQGTVEWCGRNLLHAGTAERERIAGAELAYVFQEPMSALHPTMTIREQMTRPIRKHLKLGRRDARDRASDLLAQVGIPPERNVLESYVHQLSGGMRQRVMIAMSISCEPSVLIADEPTTALDATIQQQILDLLLGLREELDLSMILISHDLGLIERYTDDLVVMLDGYAMESGRTAQVVADPSSGYTQGLLEAAPRLGQRRDRLPVIDRSKFTKVDR